MSTSRMQTRPTGGQLPRAPNRSKDLQTCLTVTDERRFVILGRTSGRSRHTAAVEGARGRRKHVIMDKAELLSYIRARRLAVIGTIGPDGSPQGALVGVAVTDGFQIIFDTGCDPSKYQNRHRDTGIVA